MSIPRTEKRLFQVLQQLGVATTQLTSLSIHTTSHKEKEIDATTTTTTHSPSPSTISSNFLLPIIQDVEYLREKLIGIIATHEGASIALKVKKRRTVDIYEMSNLCFFVVLVYIPFYVTNFLPWF